MVRVGVLALQGDFLEHIQILHEIGVKAVAVKKTSDLTAVDSLIVPGGESTTIGNLLRDRGLGDRILDLVEGGLPVMGTCAGAVLLAKKVVDRVVGETGQYILGVMNIEVIRNAFGRQRDSFIADIELEEVGSVRVAFIRAPVIENAHPPARIIGYLNHPTTGVVGVAARENSLLALTFHPEITSEKRVYEYFINFVKR